MCFMLYSQEVFPGLHIAVCARGDVIDAEIQNSEKQHGGKENHITDSTGN